jgi:hypothetical protein
MMYLGRYTSRSDVGSYIVNLDRVVGSYTMKLSHLVTYHSVMMVLYISTDYFFSN